jgi:hypothetical protein
MRKAQMGYKRTVKDQNWEEQWKENWWIDESALTIVARRNQADGYSERGSVHGPTNLMENPIMRMLWRRRPTFFEGVREVSMTFRQQLSSLFILLRWSSVTPPPDYAIFICIWWRGWCFRTGKWMMCPATLDFLCHSHKIVLFIVITVRTSNQLY